MMTDAPDVSEHSVMTESDLERIASILSHRKQTLATAESCTGGLVGHLLTTLPGSSHVYLGGIIAYANNVKVKFLGVTPDQLAMHGAVSAEVAEQMARGIRTALSADYGCAITGIAGPDGGSPEKPVGLVYIGLADGSQCIVNKFVFEGDRHAVKTAASDAALAGLVKLLGGRDVSSK
ncbi:MAG: CinA family protein [Verrucomicrobia bacterium]|nr:CinA family protein [Verrucomicrobiota bacterium]